MKRSEVSIFLLVDALGWDYIKGRHFLTEIATTKKPVKSILGFSSGVIPSILSGKYPQEHKHWFLYFYSPQTSPFRWTKSLLWMPKKALNSRVARKVIEEISKRMMGYSGYFETYLIPVEHMHLFDICENRNIYAPGGMRNSDSIFDILCKKKIDYRCFNYPLKDREIFEKAKNSLSNRENSYYFLYLSESDAILHKACHDKVQVNKMVDYYEDQILKLYIIAKEKYGNVSLFVFSDHSMAPVNSGFDLKEEIDSLRFEIPKDYIAFYDSTMARFWFSNSKAKEAIVNLLNTKDYGRILSEDELRRLGVKFEDNMYGEVVFLMNTGSVICPSYMGNKVPQGMHGFNVDDGVMDAIIVSNKKVEDEVKVEDVKDFFKLMSPGQCGAERSLPEGDQVTASPEKKKIKVLYFLNSIVRGGVEEHVLRLIEGLDKEKFEPVLVCPQALIDLMKSDLENLKIIFYPVCIRRWRDLSEIMRFMRILKREKPDIVHSHLFFATMFAAPIAKLAGVPNVIETAHIREAWRKGIKKAYFIDRFFCNFVDKIIAVSNAVKEYLVTEKKILSKKVEVIHNGVDIEKFKPAGMRNGKDKFHVGVIGRLEPQKGHKYFLEAIKMLGNKADNVTFSIIGDGALRTELEGMSRDFKIDDRVKFLGFRQDIKELIAQLDILVLPSLFEGLPLVALEAEAMGKAVIATNVDGTPEAIINGRTGMLVPPANSHAIKTAIDSLMDNPDIAAGLGAKAVRHVSDNFNLTKQTNKTAQLYKEIMDESSK